MHRNFIADRLCVKALALCLFPGFAHGRRSWCRGGVGALISMHTYKAAAVYLKQVLNEMAVG